VVLPILLVAPQVLVAQLQVDLHLRITLQKFRQPRGDLQTAETDGGADPQRSGHGFPAGLETVLGGIHRREDISRFVVVPLTFIGQ